MVPGCIGATILIGILSDERFGLRHAGAGPAGHGRVSYGGDLFHISALMLLGAFVPIFAVADRGPLRVAATSRCSSGPFR
jgi:hypothetical protein